MLSQRRESMAPGALCAQKKPRGRIPPGRPRGLTVSPGVCCAATPIAAWPQALPPPRRHRGSWAHRHTLISAIGLTQKGRANRSHTVSLYPKTGGCQIGRTVFQTESSSGPKRSAARSSRRPARKGCHTGRASRKNRPRTSQSGATQRCWGSLRRGEGECPIRAPFRAEYPLAAPVAPRQGRRGSPRASGTPGVPSPPPTRGSAGSRPGPSPARRDTSASGRHPPGGSRGPDLVTTGGETTHKRAKVKSGG